MTARRTWVPRVTAFILVLAAMLGFLPVSEDAVTPDGLGPAPPGRIAALVSTETPLETGHLAKVDPAVVSLLRSPREARPLAIPLVLFLEQQPTSQLAMESRGSLAVAWRPLVVSRPDLATPDTVRDASQRLERAVSHYRSQILEQAWPAMEASRLALVSELESLGVSVLYRGRLFNTLTVEAPPETVPDIAKKPGVAAIYLDSPLIGGLAISAPSMGTQRWWSENYIGAPWDVAVVDTGIDFTHPSLDEGPSKVFHRMGRLDPLYGDRPDRIGDLHGHGTHVAGIVASQNLTYRGVAYGVRDLINAKFAWRTLLGGSLGYWSDAMEAIDWAIAEVGADVISFSFGDDVNGDGESGFSRYLDAVVDSLGVSVVVGAMNFGPGEHTVGTPADAYNVITVGNMNDNGTLGRGDDDLHVASGRGPTGDGRMKPDLVAPGTSIASTSSPWSTGSLFVNRSGTSMATPHVAGAVSLLLGFLDAPTFPALLKALLVNAADDRGPPGSDVGFGWGYVNLSRAFVHRSHYAVANLSDEHSYRFFQARMGEGDRATLAWQRHVFVGGLGSTNLFANLDLEAYDAETHELLVRSDSIVDNVEQVALEGPPGLVVLKVKADGPFAAGERFALATSRALIESRPPALEVQVSLPCAVRTGDLIKVVASIRNAGDLSVRDIAFSLVGTEGLEVARGALSAPLGPIRAGGEETVSWTFRAKEEAEWSLSLRVWGTAFGEPVSTSAPGSVVVQRTSHPFVRQFGAVPEVQGIGEVVRFEATICAGTGISEAHWILLSNEGSELSNRSMAVEGEPSLYTYHQSFWSLGTHRFRVAARDWGDAWATVEGSFAVLDRRPPDILQPTVLPPVNEWGAPSTLRARVVDNSTLRSVVAVIRLAEGPELENLTMHPTSGGYWEVRVTPPEPGDYVAAFSATDALGITGTATLEFRVVHGKPPFAAMIAPANAELNKPVTLSGVPSKDDFGIETFTWRIEGPGEDVSLKGEVVTYVFRETGTYRVILLVSDSAGKLGLAEQHVRVQATLAPFPGPPWFLYLIPAAVAGLIVWLWIWRRKPM